MFTQKEMTDFIRNEQQEIAKAEDEIASCKAYISKCRNAITFWERMIATGHSNHG